MSISLSPVRSPQPFIAGQPTSSAPTTPAQTPAATGHESGLRSRVATAIDGAADVVRRVAVPVRDAAVTQALVGVLKDTVGPTATLVGNVASTVGKAVQQASQPSLSSQPLQAALQERPGANLEQPERQLAAHEQAIQYGQHSAKAMDRVLPFAHSVLRIGLAGTSMAFGVGRNAGVSAADALGRTLRDAPVSSDIVSGSTRPAAPLTSAAAGHAAAAGAMQWALGSATGAVGNMLGQFVVSPLVNMIPRQFQAIDARAVVPDEMVGLMNQLKPGAGNELRDQVKAAQGEIARIDSPSNKQLGEIAFDAVTAARFAGQGGTPLGVAGQMSFSLAVSATAGSVIGAVLATRQAVATADVPDLNALRQAVANGLADGPAVLAQVPTKSVPLFFARHSNPVASAPPASDIEQGASASASASRQAVTRAVEKVAGLVSGVIGGVGAAGATVKNSFVAGPLFQPNSTAGTLGLIGASAVRRTQELAKATVTTTALSTATAALASTIDGPAKNAVLAVGNAVGIHAAVKPWFDAIAVTIPAADNKMKASQQERLAAQASTRPPV